MPDPDGTGQTGPTDAAAGSARGRRSARFRVVSWALRLGTAAALGIDAVVHLRNAPAYDVVGASVTEGQLFRLEAYAAIAVAVAVLIRPRPSSWIAALLVSASALAAVLVYRYVDLGSIGPLPDMYEDTWEVPGKPLSAWAEAAGVVLAGLGLYVHRNVFGREVSGR